MFVTRERKLGSMRVMEINLSREKVIRDFFFFPNLNSHENLFFFFFKYDKAAQLAIDTASKLIFYFSV